MSALTATVDAYWNYATIDERTIVRLCLEIWRGVLSVTSIDKQTQEAIAATSSMSKVESLLSSISKSVIRIVESVAYQVVENEQVVVMMLHNAPHVL